MLKARLARFYGWTDREMNRMTQSKVIQYMKCIEPLMAEETLVELTVSTFPHQKKDRARKIEKDLKERAKMRREKKPKNMSTEDMYKELIRTLGNG